MSKKGGMAVYLVEKTKFKRWRENQENSKKMISKELAKKYMEEFQKLPSKKEFEEFLNSNLEEVEKEIKNENNDIIEDWISY